MSLQAEAFHVLERADGVRPFDAERLYRWAKTPAAGAAARHVVRFLLELQSSAAIKYLDDQHTGTDLGCFRAVEAIGVWDDENRTAFVVWAQDPWWA